MKVKATPKSQAKIGFMTPTQDDSERFVSCELYCTRLLGLLCAHLFPHKVCIYPLVYLSMNRHSNSVSPVRSPSPHPPTSYLSATPTPSQHTSPSHLPHPSPFSRSISKTKYQAIDVLSEYQQRESSGKSRINLVVVGMLCQLLELLSYL